MRDILSARQAAKVIGCKATMVQERIIRGEWTFGRVFTSPDRVNRRYEIYKKDLADYLRITTEEIDRRLNND